MNKEVDLMVEGMLHNGQKVFKNGIGPAFATSRMTLKKLRNLISEMGIGRVDELQRDLQNFIVLCEKARMSRALHGYEWPKRGSGSASPQAFMAFSSEEAPTYGRGSSLHRETIMPGRVRLVSKRVPRVLVLGPPY